MLIYAEARSLDLAECPKDKNPVAWNKQNSYLFRLMAAFQTSDHGNAKILAVSGRLDPQSVRDLRDTMHSLIEDAETVDLLVDLEGLDYMASTGFRELFLAGRTISRQGGRFAVCSLRGEVKRVFELASFDTAYPIFDTRHEALEFLSRPRPAS
jgi:anti-anti-sigma factor